jgi:hypothetical protein
MANQSDKGRPSTTKVPPRSTKGKAPAKASSSRAATAPPRPPRDRRPRRAQRGNFRRAFFLGGAIFAVVAIVAVIVVLADSGSGGSSKSAVNFTLADGTKVYGRIGPEGVPLQLGPQLASPNAGLTGAPIDGIQCNSSEQLVYHHHVHLAIFVNGKPYAVPLGIGMMPPAQVQQQSNGAFASGSGSTTNPCLYWLHVHAQDGIFHLESPQPGNFELGQAFGVWGQPVTATQVGPYKGTVTATLNGQVWPGDPAQIPLAEHAQIVLNVGGPTITPPPISWSGTSL